jgi:hypothetical protein
MVRAALWADIIKTVKQYSVEVTRQLCRCIRCSTLLRNYFVCTILPGRNSPKPGLRKVSILAMNREEQTIVTYVCCRQYTSVLNK